MYTLFSQWWIAAGGSLILAAALGFFAGYGWTRWSDRRDYRRARSGLSELFRTVLKSLDSARDVCALLEGHPGWLLQLEQTAQLESRRSVLTDVLTRLIVRNNVSATDPIAVPLAEMPKIEWHTESVDPATGLPDRTALEANLVQLLSAGEKSQRDSSLLLVRVDKLNTLRARHSKPEIERLFKRLSSVLCRAVRDADLVCRFGPDALGILLPGLGVETGMRQARAIRDSVRGHHFRIDDNGPEVLLTASFGYTAIRPEDNRDLVLDRAVDALTKSERVGRNQLHAHTGEALVHLAAAS